MFSRPSIPVYSPAFIYSILRAEPPCKAPASDAPDCPTMFPTNRKNVAIRAPVDCTYRPCTSVRVHVWHAKNLGLRSILFRGETGNFN